MNRLKKCALPTILLSSLIFATSSFAKDYDSFRGDCNYKKSYVTKCGSDEYRKYKKSGKYHKGSKGRFIIGAVYSLDLSKEQELKIDSFIKEFQERRSASFSAFKNDSFDKQAYINERMNRRENMIKAKADLIEKIYSVLTKEQRTKLKKELESFEKFNGKN